MALNQMEFTSIQELYQRLLPALKTKTAEIKRLKIFSITESLVFEYCLENFWRSKKDLRLHEMVDDILKVDAIKLIEYLKKEGSKY